MTTLTTESTSTPNRGSAMRTTWMVVGGLAIAAAGVAAGLFLRPAPTTPTPEPVRSSLASNESVVEPGRVSDKPMADDNRPAETKAADAKPVPAKPHPAPVHRTTPAPTQHAGNDVTPLPRQQAAVCATCGVVEGVREVQQKGKGSGLGAVAGGVAGAAVGNQFGHGNGRAAMTILGAIGGGMAGNEIEKRVKTETVYEVRIRMDDGSVRTFTQKTAPAPGTRVTVDGNTLHTTRAPQGESPQMMRTSAGA
jgi:outer membrane lipoprotein SlyB